MSDDELKRLLQGLFSDEPVEAAPAHLPEGRALHRDSTTGKAPALRGTLEERKESDPGLIGRLWASSQAISVAAGAEQVGQALMEFASQVGVDVARLLIFVGPDQAGGEAPPAPLAPEERRYLEMRDGWTADNRPAQPYGTQLPLSSYPLLEFMRADQPVVVEDVEADPRANDTVRAFMAIAGVRSFFIVPLRAGQAGQEWLGALFLGRNDPSVFAGDLVQVSWILAGQAAVALQYLERVKELQSTLQTLAQRDAEQTALINNIPDGIYFKDAESRFTRINTYQADVLLGTPETEKALGKTDWDFYAAEFAEQAWADERQIIESKQPLVGRIEKTIRRSDGQERWVSATKIPLTDEKGEVTGLVGISRDITELKAAQEQAQHRAVEMQLAAEISNVATGLLDPDQLMQQAVSLIADRFDLYYAGLFLVDDSGPADTSGTSEWAVLRAGTGKAGQSMIAAGHRLAVGGQSMIGRCVASAKAGIALDVGAEPVRFDNPLLPDTRSELALPLVSHGRAIGGLTIQSAAEAAFGQEDIAALQTMADQLANAIENARLFQERERRIQELATVTEIGQVVASALDPDTLFETVHREVSRLFDASNFYIATYEQGSDEWLSAFHLERGQRLPQARRSVHDSVTGHVIRTRQPLIFRSGQQYLDFVQEHGLTVIGEPAVSWMAAPLVAADRCVGAICVQNYDRDNLYGERDLAVFTTVAGQVAASLENARLFQEMQQRTIELQALYDVALSLGAQIDRQELLRLIVEQAVALLNAEAGGFYLYDPGAGDMVFSVATGYLTDFLGTRLKPGEGLAGQVFDSGRPQAVDDYHTWSSRAGVYDQEVRLHNLLAVPLPGRAGVLGVLDIAGGEQVVFSPQDVRLAELFAAQAAVTLENLQLLDDSRRRTEELAALHQLSLELAAEQRDVDAVLDTISRRAMALLGSDGGGIWLWREQDQEIELVVSRQVGGAHMAGRRLKPGEGLSGRALADKQIQVVDDYLAWDGRAAGFADAPFRSALAVPMLWQNQAVGVLVATRSQPDRPYSPGELSLAELMANQATAFIQNARLFEQAQHRARELAVLNDMGRALSRVLTVDAVVDSIHRYVSQLMDATNLYVALYDAEQDAISFPLYIDGDQVRRDVAGRQAGKGMTEHVIRTRQPLLIEDNLDDLLVELGVESIGQASFSWLGVPMIAGEQSIGVITVQSYTTPRVYDEHDRDLLTAVAAQAAIAIQNARLFEQTQAALAETQARARRERIGREITAQVRASIDPDAIMQAAVRELGMALGRPAFVRLGSEGPPGQPPSPAPAAVTEITAGGDDKVPARQPGKVPAKRAGKTARPADGDPRQGTGRSRGKTGQTGREGGE